MVGLMNTPISQNRNDAKHPYDRAFLRTALRMQGVVGAPSFLQSRCAQYTLTDYRLRVASARKAGCPASNDLLIGRMPEQAGVEHAFLYIRFDSIVLPTKVQSQEFHDWLAH